MKNIFLKSIFLKPISIKPAVLLITLMTLLSSTSYAADRDRLDRKPNLDRSRLDTKPSLDRHRQTSTHLRVDKRYDHNRYYPRDGYRLKTLPKRRHPIHYHDRDYFYFSGVWHVSDGPNYVVVRPPTGIIVPVLPSFYTTIWFRSTPYYYANDVYYVWRPELNGYQVTAPPTEESKPEASYLADEIFAYPKNNQSEEQQAEDRYTCHRWGVDKTGYDPTQPPENLSVTESNKQRENYNRAMKTCLEGKNYSVR